MLDVVNRVEKLDDGNTARLVCDGNPTVALAVTNETLASQLLNDRRVEPKTCLQKLENLKARSDEEWKDVRHDA